MVAHLAIKRGDDEAACALQPMRRQILAALDEPDSASGIARRLNLPRQKVRYHLVELERYGYVELMETRRKGNCLEQVMRRAARAFLVCPALLGDTSLSRIEILDRYSSANLVAKAIATAQTVAEQQGEAAAQGLRLATFAAESRIHARSPQDLARFMEDLARAVHEVCARYDAGPKDPEARPYDLFLACHPSPAEATS